MDDNTRSCHKCIWGGCICSSGETICGDYYSIDSDCSSQNEEYYKNVLLENAEEYESLVMEQDS